MSLGARVRGLLGPKWERIAADAYRRMFVDLDSLAKRVNALGPFDSLIEVGCGEGALMTRLVAAEGPAVRALGIDIAPNPGRNFTGTSANVEFRQATVAEVVAAGERFDLVVVSDVLHHVPPTERVPFLESCRALLAPGGTIVVKEWVRRRNVAHAAAYVSDYYISGDKTVAFYSDVEVRDVVVDVFQKLPNEFTVSPHRNNLVLVAQVP